MSLTSLLEQLIGFQTLTHNFSEHYRTFDWIQRQLAGIPVLYTTGEYASFPYLLITSGQLQPKIWLQAHLDVVPAASELFSARISEGKLYGRGAIDMKFALACYIKLFQDLGKQIRDYDVGIMITCDEEIGGWNGVRRLLHEGYTSQICFLPDNGGTNWEFEHGAKGAWHVTIKTSGTAAHGSRPWLGDNAIDQLTTIITEFKKSFITEPCEEGLHGHATINIGTITGGVAINNVPHEAEAGIDIRFITADEQKKLQTALESILARYQKSTYTTNMLGNAYQIDTAHPYHQQFQQIASEKYAITPTFNVSHGSSDARYFLEHEIPTILVRPNGGGHHSDEEWVDIVSLGQFYEVMRAWVIQVGKN